MCNPLTVSVIVPVYKVEKYLPECIDSILAQTFTDFELILVDDGSPDNSGKICDDYATRDSRIRVFHKENGGVSSARNLGLDNARGEWIAFVDGDDWVGERYLEHLLEAIEGFSCFVVSGWQRWKGGVRTASYLRFSDEHVSRSDALWKKGLYAYGYPFSKIYCRALIQQNNLRFDTALSMLEDAIFMLNYLRFVSSVRFLAFTEDYCYRDTDSSLSKKHFSFESELSLFIQKQKLFFDLGFDGENKAGLLSLRRGVRRVIQSIYLAPSKLSRTERLNKVRYLLSKKTECLKLGDMRFVLGFLLDKEWFGLFDFLKMAAMRFYIPQVLNSVFRALIK